METKNNWKAWLYLAPALVLMAIFTFYPLFNTFTIAFLKNYNQYSGESVFSQLIKEGVTLKNIGYVLGISEIQGLKYTTVRNIAIPNTIIITFVTVPISVIISFPATSFPNAKANFDL